MEGDNGDDCVLLNPKRYESLESVHNKSLKLRKLLKTNVKAELGLSDAEAENAVKEDALLSAGRVRVKCGDGWQVIGTGLFGLRARVGRSRADFYVAAESLSETGREGHEDAFGSNRQVFYGRVIKLVQYEYNLPSGKEIRTLVVADWAQLLHKTSVNQVYSDLRMDRVFRTPRASNLSCLLHMIGVFEHTYPRDKRRSRLVGTKTFFVDPYRRVYHLLDRGRLSPDGVNRWLAGLS